jgi:hypothetical protein
VIEIALVRLCQLDNLIPLSQLAQWLAKDGAASSPASRNATVNSVTRTVVSATASEIEKKKLDGAESTERELIPLAPENTEAIRQQLIAKAGLALGSELRRISNVAISGPNTLVLHFPARYNQRGDQILDGTRRAELEELLRGITGQACQIRIEFVAEQANQQSNGAAAPPADAPYQKARRQRAELMQLPLVSKAMDVLGAQIVGVDDEFGKEVGVKTAAGSLTESAELEM